MFDMVLGIPPDKCKECLYVVISTDSQNLAQYGCRRKNGCKHNNKKKGKQNE
jgi:hypothetical protein